MDSKQITLNRIAKNNKYLKICRKYCPHNYKDLYSEFLLIMSEKPLNFFKSLNNREDKYCLNVIYTLNKPDSSRFNRIKKNQKLNIPIHLYHVDMKYDISTNNLFKQALQNVLANETYFYNRRYIELLLEGYTKKDIHIKTRKLLPLKEIYRVCNLMYDKIRTEYNELCNMQ